MKAQEIFKHTHIISKAVPLSITALGFVYLNNIGMWNITINQKHDNCVDKKITIKQLRKIFEQKSSCFANQTDVFETKKEEMIACLQPYDEAEWITFE